MNPFHDSAIQVEFPAHVKMDAFSLQHVLKWSVWKFHSPIRLPPDRLPSYEFPASAVIKNRFKRCPDRAQSSISEARHAGILIKLYNTWSRHYVYWAPARQQNRIPKSPQYYSRFTDCEEISFDRGDVKCKHIVLRVILSVPPPSFISLHHAAVWSSRNRCVVSDQCIIFQPL